MPRFADDLHSDPLLHRAPSVEGFKVLDPAVLYAKVGQGGMGAVYRGRHWSLECDVAVKVLKADLAGDEQFVLRFEREARLAARIKNDHVVQVLDVREKNGIHYLVMEFVRGETARERVQRKGALAEPEALCILLGACRGLVAAHRDGVVHRDVKPDNVLISAEGHVKLADLGLAKQKRSSDEQSLTLLSSGVMGTPQYMPPEQWRSADVAPAADVWALGAVLWYLLAGKNAIAGGELLDIAERIRDHGFPDLAGVRSDVRSEVRELIGKCTRRDPAERFADAKDLLKALLPLCPEGDDVLVDPATGTGTSRATIVTPPPRSTLVKIKMQIASGESGSTQDLAAPLARSEQPTLPQQGVSGSSPGTRPVVRAVRMRGLGWLAAALLLVAGGSGAYDPAAEPVRERSAPASGDGPLVTAADPAATARQRLQEGLDLLPMAGRLDEAIEKLEQALDQDATLEAARKELVVALVAKADKLVATDADTAFTTSKRAQELLPDDAAAKRAFAATANAVLERWREGVELLEPKDGALVDGRTVRVRGRVTAPGRASLRLLLAPGTSTTEAPFARERAKQARIIDGGFAAALTAEADGRWFVRLEVEDLERGLSGEVAPWRAVVVDTAPPELVVESPAAGTLVGREVTFSGRVTDTTVATVELLGVDTKVAADGTWSAGVVLSKVLGEVEVAATDALGRTKVVKHPLRIDLEPPRLVVEAPALTNERELSIRGMVADANGPSLVVDGTPVAIAADGRFAAAVRFDADGERTFAFVAEDAVGNRTPQSVAIRCDTVAPGLEWVEPEADVVPPGEVRLSGLVLDDSDTEVSVNGDPAERAEGTWRLTTQIAAGQTLQFEVRAKDQAGNTATLPVRTLRGDDPVVKLAWADPADGHEIVEVDGKKYPSLVVEKQTGMRMVLIRPGAFQMGSPAGEPERNPDETQHRRVIQQAFWLGETEVTQAQWQEVMGNNPSEFQGALHPVEVLTWHDCQAYIRSLNRHAGNGFRLPSEAEWEYACRAGTITPFSFGSNVTTAQVNYDGNHPYNGASKGEYRERTVPARSLPPNPWGLYEMHGNVMEWCEDTYGDYPGTGTEEPTRGKGSRVLRGGQFDYRALGCRSAGRGRCDPEVHPLYAGFRLARTLP